MLKLYTKEQRLKLYAARLLKLGKLWEGLHHWKMKERYPEVLICRLGMYGEKAHTCEELCTRFNLQLFQLQFIEITAIKLLGDYLMKELLKDTPEGFFKLELTNFYKKTRRLSEE